MGLNSTREVLVGALGGLLILPLLGLLGAVFLNWTRLLLDSRPINYWTAYKVTTLSSMATLVFLVPAQLITNRLGSLGIIIDTVLSIVLLAVFYSQWIRNDEDQGISFEDAIWLSVIQTALWLCVGGVFFGLGLALQPSKTLWGVALAVACAALLVAAAAMSLRRQESTAPLPASTFSLKTEDLLDLHRHVVKEFDAGQRDEELWALATIARQSAEQQREWYLAERVKRLREIAENQLRREGILGLDRS